MKKRTTGLLLALAVSLSPAPVSYAEQQPSPFSEPVTEKDEALSSGLKATWDCVWFGSYPSAEVTDKEFTAVA